MTLAALALAAQASLSPCTLDQVGAARCGTYDVWENRDAKSGRKTPLNVIVLPSEGQPSRPDPLVILQGGPGDAPSFNARFVSTVFAPVRRTRDIVLIDLRGTGKSAALTCPELSRRDANGGFDEHLLNVAAVRACRTRLEHRADLRFYTTAMAVDDLDEVLGALGYEQVNVYGTSYGSRVAQSFMVRHPGRIRTVTMKGIVPQSMAGPESHARAGEDAWRALVARCAKDTKCARAYPTIAADLETLLARLEKNPPTVTLPESTSRPLTRVRVTRGLFAEAFRNVLYSPEAAAGAPKLVQKLARNQDELGLAETALAGRTLLGGERLAAGFFLSVTCTEDVPFLPKDWASLTRGTFGGDYRLREQASACAEWPRGHVPREHRQAVRSSIPTLLISGEYDPVTPPKGGDEVAGTLSQSRHVIVRNNGHPMGNAGACLGGMIAQFIEGGSIIAIEPTCADAIPPVPFAFESPQR